MFKRLIYMIVFVLVMSGLYCEIIIIDSVPQSEHDAHLTIRHHITEEEIQQYELETGQKWQSDVPQNLNYFPTRTAPDDVIKPVAEFEQSSGVMIRYPLGIPLELVRIISQDTRVVTIVSSSYQSTANTAFINANVNMENVQWLIAPSNSYWTRDFGPWFSFSADGNLNAIDFIYNRPSRPYDNLITSNYYASFDTLTAYNMGINHCGGNYMTDGYSTAMSTTLVFNENSGNQMLVEQRMLDYLGIETYHVVPDPNNTYIDHIDCWGKLLSPDKVLIRSVPSTHPQYNLIEQTAAYFAEQMSAYGRPYKVYRVHNPNNQPYTNSLILNNKVFVPIMTGAAHTTHNENALRVYQNALPGYTIYGVYNNTSNVWESTDALHCRVKELAERRIIYLEHIPLAQTMSTEETVRIEATVASFTGYSLASSSPKVFYKINSREYQSTVMTPHPYYDDDFIATLTGFDAGDTLYYYIQASDTMGKTYYHPYIGSAMAHQVVFASEEITIGDDIISPIPLQLSIYPNPLHLNHQSRINLHLSGNQSPHLQVSLYNIKGQKILSSTHPVAQNSVNILSIDLHGQNLTNGVYLMRFDDGQSVAVRKVLVIK